MDYISSIDWFLSFGQGVYELGHFDLLFFRKALVTGVYILARASLVWFILHSLYLSGGMEFLVILLSIPTVFKSLVFGTYLFWEGVAEIR